MKKIANLKNRQEVMELMKKLYGNDEVKDDTKIANTEREPGATRPSEMAKLPPNCS